MVKIKSIVSIFVVAFAFYGCGGFGFTNLGEEKKEILIEKITAYMQNGLPLRQKASFGKMKITGVTAMPGDSGKSIDFMVYFNIETFQIPEGLDGSVTYTSSLRYSAPTKLLYPRDLNGTNLSFSNQSLLEYVSLKAKKAIPIITKNFLLGRAIYQLPPTLKKSKLSKFETTSDGKLILYFE